MSDAGQTPRSRSLWAIAAVLVVALAAAAGWKHLHVDSSLEPLLPENSEARRTVLFFRDSSFASKAVLWFRLTGDAPESVLFDAADKAEKQLDPQLVKQVIKPPQEADAMEQAMSLLDRAPELLNQQDLDELEAALKADALKKRMRELYVQLTRPEGSFMQTIIRKDPLGISSRILGRLYSLTNGIGFKVEPRNGHLMHPDGRQMLLVLETSSTATSLASSKALMDNFNRIAASAPPGVEIIPMCAQIHTAQNQQLMERDTHLAGTVNGIVFLILFLLVSRDWRVGAVFLLPVISIGLTIGVCALLYPNLSMMAIGVSLTMAGSAVDYGLYVYTAVTMGKDRDADIRRIRRPLLISHLTTLGVFLAFLFSSIPAYRQLGYLTGASLVVSLLCAMFLLPRLVRPGGKIFLLGSGMPLTRWGKLMIPAVYIAAILLAVSTYFAVRTKFDSNISRLDGVTRQVRQNEENFQKTWGRGDSELGLLVVSGASAEEAAQANDAMTRTAAARFPQVQLVSLSSFWPSAATRRANVGRWKAFWTPDRVGKLRQDLAAAGEPYGFTAEAFDPFFQIVTHPQVDQPPPAMLATMRDQFTARAGDTWQMLDSFPDTDVNVAALRELARDHPEAQVVSRKALGQALAAAASSETRLLLTISAAFITVFLLALTRSPVKSLIIMLPVITGLVCMLGVLTMLGLAINIVTVVAAVVVLAITSDYGVFATYAWDNREPLLGQGMASMHLCAITTIVAGAVLVFAKHPALLMVGASLTSGLLAGYLTAFCVIPGIRLLLEMRKPVRAAATTALLLFVCLLTGCRAEPFERPPLPTLHNANPTLIRENFAAAIPDHFTSDDTVVVRAPFNNNIAVLGVLRVDHRAGTFEFYGLNHLGVEFFHVGGDRHRADVRSALPPLENYRYILLSLANDIRNIYLDVVPAPHFKTQNTSKEVIYYSRSEGGTLYYEFGGEPTVLLEKRLQGFWGNKWRARYYDYRPHNGKLYPHGITMDNGHYFYRIVIKNRDWSVDEPQSDTQAQSRP
jgi:predicted exporter